VKQTVVRALVTLAFVLCMALSFLAGRADGPHAVEDRVGVRSTPGVIAAIRDVARLEATSFHIEKVIESSDAQSRLWGFLQTKDTLLLVAVGDVVAGVDLARLHDDDVRVDGPSKSVRVRLPAPEVISSTLDEHATHVYSRSTDVLAARNEQLEGQARLAAEEQMRKAAIDQGIIERARASAGRTIVALLHSLGYVNVELSWPDHG
jgi:hypothetical protein